MSAFDSTEPASLDALYESVVQELRSVDTAFQGTAAAPARLYGGYYQAAAVLSTFEIGKIRPVTSDEEEVQYLLADSTLVSEDAKTTRPKHKGESESEEELLKALSANPSRWTLLPQIRRKVIEQLGTREALLNALNANPDRPTDMLQTILEAYLRNEAPPILSQDVQQTACTAQVVEWFQGILDNLPDPEAISRHLEAKRLLQPFEKLVGEHFSGRESQLAQLRDYVGVLAPSSIWMQLKRSTQKFLNFNEKPPLMIYGPGGVGKSTLVAKFILEHATLTRTQRFPFAYLDFDRPGLLAEEPVTLLVEAVRQIGIQYPDVREYSERVRKDWQAKLASVARQAENAGSNTQVASAKLSGEARTGFLQDFQNLLGSMGLSDEPFLLVLDTFEEVQYRSHQYISQLWDFLDEFQSIVPRLRTVFSGRALLRDFTTERVSLEELDAAAAKGFLTSSRIEPESLIDTIVKRIGGNPLSLRLAVQIFHNEGGTSENFFKKLTKGRIQSELYTRILDHIHDKNVMKLAHPGLILRRITPGLILKVLAEPCGVIVNNLDEADKLFESLSEEITLVAPGGETPTEPRALRHMPEVRRGMIELLRDDEEQKAKIRTIQENAITYYEPFVDPISRAEEIYHRLVLKKDHAIIAARWVDGVNTHLYNALDELEPAEQAFLAARLEVDVDDNVLVQATQDDWEQITARRTSNFLKLGQPDRALEALGQRTDRVPGSSLFVLEAQVFEQQMKLEQALHVVDQGLNSGPLSDTARFDLLMLAALLNLRLQRHDEAFQALIEARVLGLKTDDDFRLLEATLELLRPELSEYLTADSNHAYRDEILTLLGSVPEARLSQDLGLLRRAVDKFGREEDDLLFRAVRLVGLESATQTQLRALGRAVAQWDLAESGQADVEPGMLARIARIPPHGEIFDTWKVFVQTAPPKQVGDVVSLLLKNHGITEPVREALLDILRLPPQDERSPAQKLDKEESIGPLPSSTGVTTSEADASYTKAALQLTFSEKQSLIYAFKSAFPTRNSLADMLWFRLNLKLDSISLTDDLAGTVENVVDFAEARGLIAQILVAALDSNPGNVSLANFARPFGLTADSSDHEETLDNLIRSNPVLSIDRWRAALGEMVGRICQVEIANDGEISYGSGFLVGPNAMMTTYQTLQTVIKGETNPQRVTLRFDFKQLSSGAIVNPGTVYRLAKQDWLIDYGEAIPPLGDSGEDAASDYLNYALLRLDGVPGREPIGGERAEPEAPPRGWIHVAGIGEPQPATDYIFILHGQRDAGLRLVIGDGEVQMNEQRTRIYYTLDTTKEEMTGAPCFNSNWQLVALHAGKRLSHSGEGEGIPLSAIVARLQRSGMGDVLGTDRFDATVLRGGRVFLNRHELREALKELGAPQGRRVLIVNGPPGSGKTYTREYVYDVTFSTPNNRVVYVDLDASVYGPSDLVQAISLQMGYGLGTIPAPGDETEARWISRLCDWLTSGMMRNSAVKWWLILDGFERPLLPGTKNLIEELLGRSAEQDWRLILLNYTFELPANVSGRVLREAIVPISRADVESFILQQFQESKRAFTHQTVSAIVDQVLAASEDAHSSEVYPSARRLRLLNRAISEVMSIGVKPS